MTSQIFLSAPTQQKKDEDFKKHIEEMLDNQQKELIVKQKVILQKEEYRKKNLEHQKHTKLLKSIQNAENKQKKIHKISVYSIRNN